MSWIREAREVPALQVAMRVPRLRILTVACPNNHSAVRVWQTADGAVAQFRGLLPGVDRSPDGPTKAAEAALLQYGHTVAEYAHRPDILVALSYRSRGEHQVELAAMLTDEDAAGESFTAECRCRQNEVQVANLHDAIRCGVRRIALP